MDDYEVDVGSAGKSAQLIVRAPDEIAAQKAAVEYAEKNYSTLFGDDQPDVYASECNVLEGGADAFQLAIDVTADG